MRINTLGCFNYYLIPARLKSNYLQPLCILWGDKINFVEVAFLEEQMQAIFIQFYRGCKAYAFDE
jgi:hypothetical protein